MSFLKSALFATISFIRANCNAKSWIYDSFLKFAKFLVYVTGLACYKEFLLILRLKTRVLIVFTGGFSVQNQLFWLFHKFLKGTVPTNLNYLINSFTFYNDDNRTKAFLWFLYRGIMKKIFGLTIIFLTMSILGGCSSLSTDEAGWPSLKRNTYRRWI